MLAKILISVPSKPDPGFLEKMRLMREGSLRLNEDPILKITSPGKILEDVYAGRSVIADLKNPISIAQLEDGFEVFLTAPAYNKNIVRIFGNSTHVFLNPGETHELEKTEAQIWTIVSP